MANKENKVRWARFWLTLTAQADHMCGHVLDALMPQHHLLPYCLSAEMGNKQQVQSHLTKLTIRKPRPGTQPPTHHPILHRKQRNENLELWSRAVVPVRNYRNSAGSVDQKSTLPQDGVKLLALPIVLKRISPTFSSPRDWK